MIDQYFVDLENGTYADLYEAAGFLEQSEVSDARSMKIYLLRVFCEINRLRLRINELAFLKDMPQQFDLSNFFGGADEQEKGKKLVLLKNRLARLWKLDREARAQNNLEKFNFKRIVAKYA